MRVALVPAYSAFLALGFLGILWTGGVALSASIPLRVQHLHVVADKALLEESASEDSAATWQQACDVLGNAMTVGKGPWGYGIVTGHSCHVGLDAFEGAQEHGWILGVVKAEDNLRLTVEMPTGGSGSSQSLAMVQFPFNKWALDFLTDAEFVDMIAAGLFDQLPVAIRIMQENLEKVGASVRGRKTRNLGEMALPPPPLGLVIYRMVFDSGTGIWRPRHVGTGALSGAKSKAAKKRLHQRIKKKKFVTPVWKLKGKVPPDPSQDFIWAHNRRGRKVGYEIIQRRINDVHTFMTEEKESSFFGRGTRALGLFLKDATSAGYIGVRFGLPMLETEHFGNSQFFGLLIETRAGALDGFRMYLDIWPTVKDEMGDGTGEFGGQRVIAGWGIVFDFDGFISRAEVAPKVGLWSFKLDTPFEGGISTYNIDNALSLGIEGSIENSSDWYILRGWASTSLTMKGAQVEGTTVTASRFGVDTLFVPPGMDWGGEGRSYSLLAFYFFEQVRFLRDKDLIEPGEIDEVNTAQAYLGGGLALSW